MSRCLYLCLTGTEVGELTLTYLAFDVRTAPGQELIVYQAEPGSASADALALLARSLQPKPLRLTSSNESRQPTRPTSLNGASTASPTECSSSKVGSIREPIEPTASERAVPVALAEQREPILGVGVVRDRLADPVGEPVPRAPLAQHVSPALVAEGRSSVVRSRWTWPSSRSSGSGRSSVPRLGWTWPSSWSSKRIAIALSVGDWTVRLGLVRRGRCPRLSPSQPLAKHPSHRPRAASRGIHRASIGPLTANRYGIGLSRSGHQPTNRLQETRLICRRRPALPLRARRRLSM